MRDPAVAGGVQKGPVAVSGTPREFHEVSPSQLRHQLGMLLNQVALSSSPVVDCSKDSLPLLGPPAVRFGSLTCFSQ